MKPDNIVLIGMPGSGKSTLGVFMARAWGMTFVDSDRVIERTEGKKLYQITDEAGVEGFRAVENRVNAALDVHNSVVATGGSVIYGAEAMEHLRAIGTVVYLQLPCDTLAERLGDLHARGVSFRPGQTLRDLYDERCPLYERYAHVTLPCEGLKPREAIAQLAAMLGIDG